MVNQAAPVSYMLVPNIAVLNPGSGCIPVPGVNTQLGYMTPSSSTAGSPANATQSPGSALASNAVAYPQTPVSKLAGVASTPPYSDLVFSNGVEGRNIYRYF